MDNVGQAGICAHYETEEAEDNEERVTSQHAVETAASVDAVPERGGLYDGRKRNAKCCQAQGTEQGDEELQVWNCDGQQDCEQ